MKFKEIEQGQEFEIGGLKAVKLNGRRYQLLSGQGYRSGVIKSTSANANVNAPTGDKAHAAKQKTQRKMLNQIAQKYGFDNWSAVARAALNGEEIHINAQGYES